MRDFKLTVRHVGKENPESAEVFNFDSTPGSVIVAPYKFLFFTKILPGGNYYDQCFIRIFKKHFERFFQVLKMCKCAALYYMS